jgi:hypothetical protein
MMDVYDPGRDGFDNARLAMVASTIVKRLSVHVAELASGAWNPNFCSADASEYALLIFAELRDTIQHYEAQAIEAERAATGNTDAVEDESAVAASDAHNKDRS